MVHCFVRYQLFRLSVEFTCSTSVTHCCRNRCFVYVPRVANFAPVFARPGSSQTVGGGLTDEARRVLRALYKNDTARLYERLGAPICEWEAWYRRYGL